jgi:hypothetical protein
MSNRGRACRVLAALALIAAVSTAGAARAAAQAGGKKAPPKIVFAGGFVYHSQEIPAGATVSFTVTCPKPMTASAGAVSSGDPKVLSLLSVPSGAAAWSFGFRNTDTKAITVVVVVTCLKPAGGLPPAFLAGVVKKLRKKKSVAAVGMVPPGSTQTLNDSCPKGQTPVGDSEQSGTGATPKSARLASVTDVEGVQLTSVSLGPRAITVGLRNPGAAPATVSIDAVCLPKTFSIHGRSRSISLARASFPETVGGHGSVVQAGCPGQLPLAAGFSLPATGKLGLVGIGFGGGTLGASWAFSNSTGQPQQAAVSLVCTPGKVKFASGPGVSQSIDTQVGPITISG